eukprot:9559377-Karenia_brevis.AAC.1
MTTMTCACNDPLTRRLFATDMECAGCGVPIPPRSIRYMCLKMECQFHVCNTCKGQAQAGEREKGSGNDDAQMGEGVEGHKRVGQTPVSQRKSKKGREGVDSARHVALTPSRHNNDQTRTRMDDNDDDE